MANNYKRLYNSDKKRNQFLKLRYKEGCELTDLPNTSARELAKILKISTGLISKLESEAVIGMEAPPCTASVLKMYHDKCDCSYEYLMGETGLRKKEYCGIGKDPIFGLFDDAFFDKLKELLTDDEHQHVYVCMLRAFMNNPNNLQAFLLTIFKHLNEINKIKSDNNILKVDKDLKTAPIWFSLNTNLNHYFENVLLPDLQYKFKQYENDQMEKQAAYREQFEQQVQSIDFNTPVATTGEYEEYQKSLEQYNNITNIHITPLSEENHL